MPTIISIVPVSPMRSGPSHKSEQVSQLLFGEPGEVIESTKDFFRIKCIYDGYEGWCQASQVAEITDEQAGITQTNLTSDWSTTLTINNTPVNVPFGSSVSLFSQGKFSCKNYKGSYHGDSWDIQEGKYTEETIKLLSYKYLNSSYLWGGKSVFGVDCSGFCQMVFKFMNIPLLRDASQQATQGEDVGFLEEAKCGDLAFFDNDEGKITHVGILLDPTTIIHASGRVRVDPIDNAGILNAETGLRTHKLRLIKRIKNKG